ncbi:hypothetical protein MTR67_018774 [Solanum verrucosum]|uniref:Uncharacterized protein n=1 Tax=Solanum verrucosum TaxID=315347 RepID=A0AAF0TMZ2_SOLVR|nr:hypothetical protein MTR67_018774 [Solanum verrucosum]
MIFSRDISLEGTWIPWEVISLLANLPNLEWFYAFAGTNWTLNEDVVFRKLKYLRIVEADLQRWDAGKVFKRGSVETAEGNAEKGHLRRVIPRGFQYLIFEDSKYGATEGIDGP